ncbi:hypothetical protein tb265_16240 [Gemmatimonadetes bacterium T265]|nr:hypothetical protein tb265_16240 [Gemmatimonadetes bacterium T265]
MRVVYYTFPHLLEPALLFARAMGRLAEFHLVLELAPGAWSAVLPDGAAPADAARGVVPADAVLGPGVPAGVAACWRDLASFHVVRYANRRTYHPATLPVSRRALRFLKALRPDVLHFDDVSPRLALDVPERPRIDLLNVHDPEVHRGEEDWRRDLARALTFPTVGRFVLHNRVQVAGFRARYRVRPERVAVSRLGVYTLFREWADGPAARGRRTVLFFGRLSEYKGLDLLYRAMPLVAESVPGVQFVVAGRPAFGYRPPLPPALPNGGTVGLVERHVPNAELAALVRAAAVVVCPYVGATQSGVVLTAYAFGTPVVATRVGGLPEYVRDGETGLVVPPDDPPALADALARVLRDETLRRELRLGVERAAAGELSWGVRARDVLALYEGARRLRRRR